MTDEDHCTLTSKHSLQDTLRRLEAALAQRGLTIFARVDHAANAASVNLPLRPTLLMIFGNPKGGTILMQDRQSAGLDLPLKALLWEDTDGTVRLTYNAPAQIAKRHQLGSASAAAVTTMSSMMEAMMREIVE